MPRAKWIVWGALVFFGVRVFSFEIQQSDDSGNINELNIGLEKPKKHLGNSLSINRGSKKSSIKQNLKPFEHLSVSLPCQLNYEQSSLLNIRVEADQDVLKALSISVIGKRLIIDTKKGFSTRLPIRIWVSSPSLRKLNLDGVTDANLSGLDGKQLAISITGTTDFKGQGVIDNCTLTMSGASNVDMKSVKCKDILITGEGSFDASVYASKTINGSLSGAVDLIVYGKPGNRNIDAYGAVDIEYN